jgi:hypothetical protein
MIFNNPSTLGLMVVLNLFARGYIVETFDNFNIFANYNPLLKKLLIALPIYFETKDWFISLLITLSLLILNEFLKPKIQKYHIQQQEEEKNKKQ